MKHVNILLACLFASNVFAQVHKKSNAKNLPQKQVEYALIQGHIKNNQNELLDYGLNDFFNYNLASVPVDKQGNF